MSEPKCGCRIRGGGVADTVLVYCHMHASAPAMLAMLERLEKANVEGKLVYLMSDTLMLELAALLASAKGGR